MVKKPVNGQFWQTIFLDISNVKISIHLYQGTVSPIENSLQHIPDIYLRREMNSTWNLQNEELCFQTGRPAKVELSISRKKLEGGIW